VRGQEAELDRVLLLGNAHEHMPSFSVELSFLAQFFRGDLLGSRRKPAKARTKKARGCSRDLGILERDI
jgi:hypothetical protein